MQKEKGKMAERNSQGKHNVGPSTSTFTSSL